LVVLAILATVGGIVGISTAFTGAGSWRAAEHRPRMSPVIWNSIDGAIRKAEEGKWIFHQTRTPMLGTKALLEQTQALESVNGSAQLHPITGGPEPLPMLPPDSTWLTLWKGKTRSETATRVVFIIIRSGRGRGNGTRFISSI